MAASVPPVQNVCAACARLATTRVCAVCELVGFCSDECERSGARAHRSACKPRAEQTPLDDVLVMTHQFTSQIEACPTFKSLVYGLAAIYASRHRALCVEVPRRGGAAASTTWRLSSCASNTLICAETRDSLARDIARFRRRAGAFPVVHTRSFSVATATQAIAIVRPRDGGASHEALRQHKLRCAELIVATARRHSSLDNVSSVVVYTAASAERAARVEFHSTATPPSPVAAATAALSSS